MNSEGMPGYPPLRKDEDIYMNEKYDVLFEDDALLIVVKGAPLPAHAVSRFQTRNLLSMLERDYGQKMHLANRLDSETSGLMIVARNEHVAGLFGSALQAKKVRKEYQAVVIGAPPQDHGSIETPLLGRRDLFCHVYEPHPEGKNAHTEYRLIEKNKKYALLHLTAHTGKTHQLRVHLKSLGCPIAGDKIYINIDIYNQYVHHGWQEWMAQTVGLRRLALHACFLEFQHPLTKEKLVFKSELPQVLRDFYLSGEK